MKWAIFLSGLAFLTGTAETLRAALPENFEESIAAIQAVGAEGKGNTEAAVAWKAITSADSSAVLPLLRAMEKSGPRASNWLRSAVEAIVDREMKAETELPLADLQAFLQNREQSPRARWLAFDLIARSDPMKAAKLVPGFLNDPSTELRREAVRELMLRGKELAGNDDKRSEAVAVYREALDAARDIDQIEEIAKQLTEKLEQEIDLPKHFGFLMHWDVIAPFDNTGRKGFDTEFPPENEVDLAGTFTGKEGKEAKWQKLVSTDEYGKVDLNTPYSPLKEVTGYAFAVFKAAEARPAELRLSCKNAWKIWLNGQLVFGRDEYHRGQRIDQYRLPIELKEGDNTILVKLCQNEQTESWTVEWDFKLRVCDATGTAILATDRPPTPKPEAPKRRPGKGKGRERGSDKSGVKS